MRPMNISTGLLSRRKKNMNNNNFRFVFYKNCRYSVKTCLIVLLLFSMLPIVVLATEIDQDLLQRQMNMVDFSVVDSVINKATSENIDIRELVMKAIRGELDFSFSNMWNWIYINFFNEIYQHITLMRNLIVISFLSAILKNLTASLKETAVSELGFYTSYIVLIMIVFSTFNDAVVVVRSLIGELIALMQASVPLMVSLVYLSGNFTSAYALNPLILFATNILSFAISSYIVPVIVLAAMLQMINHLSNRDILDKFSALIEKIVSFLLKASATAFIALLSLQGLTAPILNNTINKTAKVAINAVPVVGEVLTGTVDMVMAYSNALKGGTMAGLLIIIIVMCALPILKLLILVLIYKFTAALIQPICDSRVVKCLDTVGSFVLLLLGAAVTVAIMFVFSVIVMLSF